MKIKAMSKALGNAARAVIKFPGKCINYAVDRAEYEQSPWHRTRGGWAIEGEVGPWSWGLVVLAILIIAMIAHYFGWICMAIAIGILVSGSVLLVVGLVLGIKKILGYFKA